MGESIVGIEECDRWGGGGATKGREKEELLPTDRS